MPKIGEISVARIFWLKQTNDSMTKDLWKKIFILSFILMLMVSLDQWTKALAVEFLKAHPGHDYLGGIFQLIYAENPGAFLGMGSGWSRSVRFVVFGLAVTIGLIAMLWSILRDKLSDFDFYAYAFILAGGIGNVIDRLTHENGHVIDFMFIDLKLLSWLRTGVFNIADICIVIGVTIAFIPMILEAKQKKA